MGRAPLIGLPVVTERLILRGFEPADAPAMLAVYGDAQVMRHVGEGRAADLAGAEAMLAEYAEHQRRHGFSFWAVVERESGALIGDAGLYRVDDEVEVGYTLGRAWWAAATRPRPPAPVSISRSARSASTP